MQTVDVSSLTQEELERKLSTLHYFKEVRRMDEGQFNLLMQNSRLLSLEPGETMVHEGDRDRTIYFLIRGELEAVVGDDEPAVLGRLRPGEVFGETALLQGSARTASIRVPEDGKSTSVLATDGALFAADNKKSGIALKTQLIFFRQMVHMLRWRNDAYRFRYPENAKANSPYRVRPFRGNPGTREELFALREQAVYLSRRLVELNKELGILPAHPLA